MVLSSVDFVSSTRPVSPELWVFTTFQQLPGVINELDWVIVVFVAAGSEATADSGSLEVDARLISRFARSRASLCLARVVLRWLGVSKQSQRSPSCPRAGLTNWQKR